MSENDPVAMASSHLEALTESRAALEAERKACVERIEKIDELMAAMGGIGKPKRGRPRRKKGGATEENLVT